MNIKNHFFNVSIAEQYGVDAAILINHMSYWIEKNQANKINFHDGYYWTYNSAQALSEIFSYWSEKQIYRLMVKVEKLGLIKSGNYNKSAYDRTKWYTICEKSICRMYKLHFPISGNQTPESVQPIPDNKTDNNSNNTYICKGKNENLENGEYEAVVICESPKTTEVINMNNLDNVQLAETSFKSTFKEKEKVSAKKEKECNDNDEIVAHVWCDVNLLITAQELLKQDQAYFETAYLMKFPKLRDDMDHILEQFSLACETDERRKSYYHPIDDLRHCRASFLKWLNTWNRNEKNSPKKKKIDNSPSDFTGVEVDPGWD